MARRLALSLSRWRRPLAGCCVAVFLASALLVLRPPPVVTVDVVVAARDLSGMAPLTPADTTVRAVPARFVPEGAFPADDDPAGLPLSGPMRAGEVLTTARLAHPPAAGYGPDMVAAPVRIADPDAAALVGPGSRVDILATAHEPFGADSGVPGMAGPADVVVADRPVIAAPAREATGTEPGGLLVVAVSETEARELAAHAASGSLSITIRG